MGHRVEEDAAEALGLEPEHGLAAPRLGAEALDAEGEGPPQRLEEVVVGPASRSCPLGMAMPITPAAFSPARAGT